MASHTLISQLRNHVGGKSSIGYTRYKLPVIQMYMDATYFQRTHHLSEPQVIRGHLHISQPINAPYSEGCW